MAQVHAANVLVPLWLASFATETHRACSAGDAGGLRLAAVVGAACEGEAGSRLGGVVVVAERIWLDVGYADKDAAKAAGARWDPAARAWYAGPRGDLAALARWTTLPVLLPGEDRCFGAGLFVDLVPASC